MKYAKSSGLVSSVAALAMFIIGPLLVLEALLEFEQTGVSLTATVGLSVLLSWLVCAAVSGTRHRHLSQSEVNSSQNASERA